MVNLRQLYVKKGFALRERKYNVHIVSTTPSFAATVHIVLITLYFRIGTNHFFCVYLKIQNNDI